MATILLRQVRTSTIRDPTETRPSATAGAGQDQLIRPPAARLNVKLKAANGEIIAFGEGYTSRSAGLNGIESIKASAAAAPIVETDA
ncbi:YegP family protein [Streptodolium elevatio]|uniref:YegP family protein n=1 Tax=Streptodolium elevatio TaxID=3157996 RepID=A0ABV3DWR7_9ACTN